MNFTATYISVKIRNKYFLYLKLIFSPQIYSQSRLISQTPVSSSILQSALYHKHWLCVNEV